MAKFLKEGAEYIKGGITLTGDGEGNDGVLALIGFEKLDRYNKHATVTAAVFKNSIAKDGGHLLKLDEFYFDVDGEDFDKYIAAEPTEEETDCYLFCLHRCYEYMTDKAALYDIEEVDTHEYKKFTIWTD